MKTEFNRHFLKDIGKLPTAELKNEVAGIILAVEAPPASPKFGM